MSESIVLERRFKTESSIRTERLSRRRVYILPTKNGLLFAVMLVVIFLGAINYNNSLAFVLTFLLSSVTLVSMFYTYRNLAGLILTPGKPEAVYAGEVALFPVFFDNRLLHDRYSLTMMCKRKSNRWYKPGTVEGEVLIVDIAADHYQRIDLPKQSHHRGLLKYGRLQIVSTFPLGLFRAWSNIDINKHCVIYPNPKGQEPLPKESETNHAEQSGRQEGNDDFMGLRRYRVGDSSRHLDWKAFAREKGLHRKQFEGFGSSRLILSWQQLAHLNSTEAILSQLCQWILSAESHQHAYGLELPNVQIPIDHGPDHQERCLMALAMFGETR